MYVGYMEVSEPQTEPNAGLGNVDAVVNRIAGMLNVQHARLVDQAVLLLANEQLWVGQGMTTMTAWLRWRCGVSHSTAKALVTVAERVDELPQSVAAFRGGQLSLDQMATIARHAPSWTDEQSRDYAVVMTVPQLQRVLAKYPFPDVDAEGRDVATDCVDASGTGDPRPDTDTESQSSLPAGDAAAPHEADVGFEETCSLFQLDDGTFRLSAHLDADTGRTVRAGLNEAHDRLFNDGQTDLSLADALGLMAEQSLGSVSDPARRARFRIALHIDTDTGALLSADGCRLSDAIRQRFTCDGVVTPVFCEGGLPVSVGRAQHIVPTRTRTIIERRDGACCRVPGCTATLGLEVHHIIHWEHDGPTDTWNLVLICGHHHRLHHRGRLGLTGNADRPDGVEFRNQHGNVIAQSGAAPDPPTEGLSEGPMDPTVSAPRYQHPDGGRLDPAMVWFQPPAGYINRVLQQVPSDAAYLAALAPPGC